MSDNMSTFLQMIKMKKVITYCQIEEYLEEEKLMKRNKFKDIRGRHGALGCDISQKLWEDYRPNPPFEERDKKKNIG